MDTFSNSEILSNYFNVNLIEFKTNAAGDDEFEDFYTEFCLSIDDGGMEDMVVADAFMAKIDLHYELLEQ